MQIGMIDALDLIGGGGYVDLETGECIRPYWFSMLCEDNYNGYSMKDYEYFRSHPERYLNVPRLRLCGFECPIAVEFGISKEELESVGMNKKEYWEVWEPHEDEVYTNSHCSDEEWEILKYLKKRMIEEDILRQYESLVSERMENITKEWFKEHGVDVIKENITKEWYKERGLDLDMIEWDKCIE